MFFLAHLRWIFDKLDGAPVAKILQQETDVLKNNWNFIGLSFFCLGVVWNMFFQFSYPTWRMIQFDKYFGQMGGSTTE